MIFRDWVHIFMFIVCASALIPLLGRYLFTMFVDRSSVGSVEGICYRIGDIDPKEEMTWKTYAKSLFIFNFIGFAFLFLIQILQGALPLNPQNFSAVPVLLAFNTAISFTTNTNWQSYAGETTLSYLTQMLGLTVQNFLSAATGFAVLLALIRGIKRHGVDIIGNFWVDIVRTTVYLLIPLSIVFAVFLVSEGVIQTFAPYEEVMTLEQGQQVIPLGPVASQVAIKQLGTNGGGFFNANSAHPFENPSSSTNLLEMVAIILIPAASIYMYGKMVGTVRHAAVLFFVMLALWMGGVILSLYFEHGHDALFDAYPLVEGKETRFGITNTILWSVSTSGTSNGSVNGMLSSLSPIAGGVSLFNIMLGEIIFGGVGVGLCSMIMFVILTVFLSGLMVGRTPEYLGKKIEKKEMQWVILAVLLPGVLILVGSGVSSHLPLAVESLGNQGPHGLSEILYAFSSAAGNNGSAFAGLNANTAYYNLALAVVMLGGRMAIILPSLAIAGLIARKKVTPSSKGTFSTESLLFAVLLISVILIVGALTFFPALSLGPIVEHLLMNEARAF